MSLLDNVCVFFKLLISAPGAAGPPGLSGPPGQFLPVIILLQ